MSAFFQMALYSFRMLSRFKASTFILILINPMVNKRENDPDTAPITIEVVFAYAAYWPNMLKVEITFTGNTAINKNMIRL